MTSQDSICASSPAGASLRSSESRQGAEGLDRHLLRLEQHPGQPPGQPPGQHPALLLLLLLLLGPAAATVLAAVQSRSAQVQAQA